MWRIGKFLKLILFLLSISIVIYFYIMIRDGFSYTITLEPPTYSQQDQQINRTGYTLPYRSKNEKRRIEKSKPRDSVSFSPHSQNTDGQCLPLVSNFSVDLSAGELYKKTVTEGLRSFYDPSKDTIKFDKLYVYVVPFSHMDPGWLKTFGGYISETDDTLKAMLKFMKQDSNSAMTFTWAEIIFFNEWWIKLNETTKEEVRNLIKTGKFELNSGSWVMTDEASTHYWASIDNIIEGHQFLKEEFGEEYIPTVAWSNDPFGYSSTTRYLFQLANISNFILHRVNTNVKEYLKSSLNTQFKWRQYFDKSGRHDTLIHLLHGVHYDIPNTCGAQSQDSCCSFDFVRIVKYYCGGTHPVAITDANVQTRSTELVENYKSLAQFYKPNHILVVLGDDFRFLDDKEWELQHDNYIKLFNFINSNETYNMAVKFSTFKEYFEAVNSFYKTHSSKISLKTLQGDFFPYFDYGTDSWSGYFTSRPVNKKLDRQVQAMIRAADICSSMVLISKKRNKEWFEDKFELLRKARRDLALFQHHDAITGTSKEFVVKDYNQRLYDALLNASSVLAASVDALVSKEEANVESETDSKWIEINFNKNYSYFPTQHIIKIGQKSQRVLSVYNSLPYKRTEIVSVLVNASNVEVKKCSGSATLFQINPSISRNAKVSTNFYELLISVDLPPLAVVNYCIQLVPIQTYAKSVATIFVSRNVKNESIPRPFVAKNFWGHNKTPLSLTNGHIRTIHNRKNGYLQEIMVGNKTYDAKVHFTYYQSLGGAYIFTPMSETFKDWEKLKPTLFLIKGPLREEVHSIIDGLYHKIVLSKLGSNSDRIALDIENIVDISAKPFGELAMRINSSISNKNKFYTDSNGFQLMEREFLSQFTAEKSYYPISSAILIEDKKSRMTILTGQPHGGTSPFKGTLELMLDRKLRQDDLKGLGESVNDNLPVRSNFRLIIESAEQNSGYIAHSMDTLLQSHALLYRPVVFYHTKDNVNANFNDYLPLKENFPCDFHLLNVRPLNENNDFSLILHRVHTNCNKIKKTSHSCRFNDVGLDEFISLLGKSHVTYQTCTLSGISNEENQDSYSNINYKSMKLMEIKNFCFTLPP